MKTEHAMDTIAIKHETKLYVDGSEIIIFATSYGISISTYHNTIVNDRTNETIAINTNSSPGMLNTPSITPEKESKISINFSIIVAKLNSKYTNAATPRVATPNDNPTRQKNPLPKFMLYHSAIPQGIVCNH